MKRNGFLRVKAWPEPRLVRGCLADNQSAWFELDRRFVGRLERFAHILLRRGRVQDGNVAVELVAKVLESLWERHGRRLRNWSAEKRRLLTHLVFLVRHAVYAYLDRRDQWLKRERAMEPEALQQEMDRHAAKVEQEQPSDPPNGAPRPHLSGAERLFLERHLNHEDMTRYYLPGYYRKLKAQIEKKLSIQLPPYPTKDT